MKAIMLAAGKSTRTYPLTVTKPKPLLPLLDKTIIEYNLDQLVGIVEEVILVVGYKKEMIEEKLSDNYNGISIKYVEQKKQLGTGHALLQCKEHLQGVDKFIVMGSDDLFAKSDIEIASKCDSAILVSEVKNPEDFGTIETENDDLKRVNEKLLNPKTNLASTGFYVFSNKIVKYLENVKTSERGEIELTDAVNEYVTEHKIRVVTIKELWFPISYPWNLLEANVLMLNKRKEFSNKAEIEDNVTIKGDVIIGEGTVIKSGSYIEGPVYIGKNCTIGPLAHIRKDTIIRDNCELGKMELYDDLIMDNTTGKHNGYVGHSVIGENVNFGANTVTADFRHDGKNHITLVKKNKVDTGRRKLGAFFGDNVHTGIGTLIYPGRKLWPKTSTLPGEIVQKDKTE